ncbi:hypothetical protein B4U80_14470, partial [Leptotrombidium deliense]
MSSHSFKREFKKRIVPSSGTKVLYFDERETDNTIPEVEAEIAGKKVLIKLDSGCQTIAISKKCAEKLGLQERSLPVGSNMKYVSASGEDLGHIGSVKVKINFNGYIIDVYMQVLRNLKSDVLLGAPFFHKQKAVIDFLQSMMFLDAFEKHSLIRIRIPFANSVRSEKLISSNLVVIPPRSEATICVESLKTLKNDL